MTRHVINVLLMSLLAFPVWSAIEENQFETEEQEERFRELTDVMRCPKCLNVNLSGSDAPIAADLRQEIYEQIMAGRSNEEIIEYMTSRYGDFVMYRPPLRPGTYVLWFGPPILLIIGFFAVRRTMKKSQEAEPEGNLSPEESRKLNQYLSSYSDDE